MTHPLDGFVLLFPSLSALAFLPLGFVVDLTLHLGLVQTVNNRVISCGNFDCSSVRGSTEGMDGDLAFDKILSTELIRVPGPTSSSEIKDGRCRESPWSAIQGTSADSTNIPFRRFIFGPPNVCFVRLTTAMCSSNSLSNLPRFTFRSLWKATCPTAMSPVFFKLVKGV